MKYLIVILTLALILAVDAVAEAPDNSNDRPIVLYPDSDYEMLYAWRGAKCDFGQGSVRVSIRSKEYQAASLSFEIPLSDEGQILDSSRTGQLPKFQFKDRSKRVWTGSKNFSRCRQDFSDVKMKDGQIESFDLSLKCNDLSNSESEFTRTIEVKANNPIHCQRP